MFAVIGIYIIRLQKDKIISDTDLRMLEQVDDLQKLINVDIANANQYVANTHKVAENILEKYQEKANNMRLIKFIANDNKYVDEVSNITGGSTVSVFEKTDLGLVRTSTSLVVNGERSIGSVIGTNTEVYQTLLSGSIFSGRAIVLDSWYITSYFPIKENGNIVGAVGVGVKEKDMSRLKDLFLKKKYFESGYPFLVDADGLLIIHPTIEGQNIASNDFFKQMTSSSNISGKSEYI